MDKLELELKVFELRRELNRIENELSYYEGQLAHLELDELEGMSKHRK